MYANANPPPGQSPLSVLDDAGARGLLERMQRDIVFRYRLVPRSLEYVSPSIESIFDRSAESFLADPGSWFDRFVAAFPDSWAATASAGDRAAAVRDRDFDLFERVVVADEHGRAVVVEGTIRRRRRPMPAPPPSERLCRLLDHTTDMVLLVDAEGTIEYGTRSVEKTLGISPENYVGHNAMEVVHPDDVARVSELFAQLTSDEYTDQYPEFRIRHTNGSWRHVVAVAANRFDDAPLGAVVLCLRDITEFRHAEARALEVAEVVASSSDSILSCDADLNVRTCNAAAARFFDAKPNQIVGRPLPALLHGNARREITRLCHSALRQGHSATSHTKHRNEHGATIGIRVIASPAHDTFGTVIGVAIIMRETSDSDRRIFELRQSEQRFRRLFAHSSICQMVVDDGSRFVAVNEALCRLLGYSEHELLGKRSDEITYPDDRGAQLPAVEHILNGPTNEATFEKRYVGKNGDIVHAIVAASGIEDDDGAVRNYLGLVRDITAEKRAEEARRQSERRYQVVLDELSEGVVVIGADETILGANRSATRVLGDAWKRAPAGTTFAGRIDAHHEDGSPFAPDACPAHRVFSSGQRLQGVVARTITPAGERWLSIDAAPLTAHDGGEPYAVVVSFRDITEERAYVASLAESEERFRAGFDESFAGQAIMALDGRMLRVNEEICRMVGRSAAEMLQLRSTDVMGATQAKSTLELRAAMMRGELAGYRTELALVRADGTNVPVLLNVALVRDRDGAPLYVVAQVIDISETKRIEQQLQAAQERYRLVLDNLSEVVFQIDASGEFAYVSRAWEALTQFPAAQMQGTSAISYVHPDDQERAANALARAVDDETLGGRLRFRVVAKDGSVRFCESRFAVYRDDDGAPAGILGTLVDVSERERLEVDLRHAQKLEAVGRLAAGIAHEINTPIQFVGDNLHFLSEAFEELARLLGAYREQLHDHDARSWEERRARLEEVEEGVDFDYLQAEVPEAAGQALDGVQRVARIVAAMKNFGHPDHGERHLADVNQALDSTLVVARNEYKYVADLVTEFGELPLVPCYVGDLNQVFLNLVVNAAHAIADAAGGDTGRRGTITVRTEFDADRDEVVISVADTGTGIPAAARPHIFEPFFTTKDVGRGTGQGLALARAVVTERHGGTLAFETAEGRGTTFTVRLPAETASATEAVA